MGPNLLARRPVVLLDRYCQRHGLHAAEWQEDTHGADPAQCGHWTMGVQVGTPDGQVEFAEGEGATREEAEVAAATAMLEQLSSESTNMGGSSPASPGKRTYSQVQRPVTAGLVRVCSTAENSALEHPIMLLSQYCQKYNLEAPEWQEDTNGVHPGQCKQWIMTLQVGTPEGGIELSQGEGATKKEAQAVAASAILDQLSDAGIDVGSASQAPPAKRRKAELHAVLPPGLVNGAELQPSASNSVLLLNNYCQKYKLKAPVYKEDARGAPQGPTTWVVTVHAVRLLRLMPCCSKCSS